MKPGKILEIIRTQIEDVTYKEFSAIIKKENPSAKASKSTLVSLETDYRPDQVHVGAELSKAIESLYGIDLYQSVMDDTIVVVDPTKLKPDNVQLLRDRGATLQKFPLFDKNIPPFEGQKKYPTPFCLLPSVLHPEAEFGIQVADNSMAPAINKGDYVYCGKKVNSKDIKQGQIYLLSFDTRSGRTFKIGRAEKKEKEIVLVQAKPGSKPIVIPEDAVKGIYKVVGQDKGEAGVNQ